MPSKFTSNRAIAFYLIGAIIGGGIGALIGSKMLEKYRKEALADLLGTTDEDFDLENWVHEEVEETLEEGVVINSDASLIVDQGYKTTKLPIEKKKGKHPEPKEEMDYSKISKRDQVKQPIGDVARKYIVKDDEPLTNDPNSPIQIISLEEYVEGGKSHEKRDLTYYEADDTLADEDEKIIADPDSLIGSDALVSFGKLSTDPDIVYVRNTKLGEDYEVTRVQEAYAEIVLGIVPEKPKARTKKVKKMPDESDE